MRAFMANARARVRKVTHSAIVARITVTMPALAGMTLVSAGVALIFLPAGLIAAGILCLFVDARL